jgi:hypothetical protein
MESSDARAYINRWQAVEKIERKEWQSTSLTENWRQLNAIKQRANRLGIIRDTDDGEMQVFLLWAKLKANYVPN